MAALNSEFSLIYFPLLAKGFGVALVAEFSGLPYDGPKTLKWTSKTDWKALQRDLRDTDWDAVFKDVGTTCAEVDDCVQRFTDLLLTPVKKHTPP